MFTFKHPLSRSADIALTLCVHTFVAAHLRNTQIGFVDFDVWLFSVQEFLLPGLKIVEDEPGLFSFRFTTILSHVAQMILILNIRTYSTKRFIARVLAPLSLYCSAYGSQTIGTPP